MLYIVAQEHPTNNAVSVFTTEDTADAIRYKAIADALGMDVVIHLKPKGTP